MKTVSKEEYLQFLKEHPEAEFGEHMNGYVIHHSAEQILAVEKKGEYYLNETTKC